MDLRTRYVKILWIVFIVYLAALLRITVFRSGFDLANAFHGGNINFIPILDLAETFLEDKYAFVYLFFGNIIWFVPFGFLMRKLTRMTAGKIIFFGFLLSLFIEVSQFIFDTGVSEIDDLLLNTLGAAIGTVIFGIIPKIKK